MDIWSDVHEIHGPNGGKFWYANQAITADGKTAEVHIFADDLAEATLIGQGSAIAKNHHMNRGPRYVASRKDYEENFGD